jgi:hypothetical protein
MGTDEGGDPSNAIELCMYCNMGTGGGCPLSNVVRCAYDGKYGSVLNSEVVHAGTCQQSCLWRAK